MKKFFEIIVVGVASFIGGKIYINNMDKFSKYTNLFISVFVAVIMCYLMTYLYIQIHKDIRKLKGDPKI